MFLFDILYLFFLLLGLPLWVRYLFKKSYRRLLRGRLSPGIEPGEKKRTWIHAVSVGEVKSLKSLIEQLDVRSDREIVLSVTTPAGFEFAQKEYKSIKVINSPFDFSFTVKKFLKQIDPEILILNELEIWPNWSVLTRRAGVPICLINGRISEPAFRRYKVFNFFLGRFFKNIDRFLVQAEIYEERFSQLGVPSVKIVVCGNIKADTAFDAAERLPTDIEIRRYLKIAGTKRVGAPQPRRQETSKPVFTLASTHRSDEDIIIPILKRLCENFAVILVPRHLDRVEEIEKALSSRGVKYARWSSSRSIDIEAEVLIFDKMGYLFNVMKISDVVFMGGTFDRKIGGHNLYEPAVLGKLIVGGPWYNNFPDIGRELENRGVYKKVTGADELMDFLSAVDSVDFEKVKVRAEEAVFQRRGSVDCILREVQAVLES
ncbi:MAG: hypothetical protein KAW12_20505 [Candidatus Aminicenantes bacterium]|nr:hypothetical protein [Candidatus Aminicenantes bacterium]